MGFLVLDSLAEKQGIALTQHRFNALFGKGKVGKVPIVTAKPMTYMNASGQAAKALLETLNLTSRDMIVIYDDIDLPLGKIKVRHKGGDAGQKGVKSIIQLLGTDQFTRIRIGIGRPEDPADIVDYVLSPFLEEEWSQVNEIIETALDLTEQTIKELENRPQLEEEDKEC